MSGTSWEDMEREFAFTPAEEGRIEAERHALREREHAYRLAELRHRAALTQVEVAAAIGVSQNAVSKLENGAIERSALITLKNYIEALGGHLEVVARFDGEILRLS